MHLVTRLRDFKVSLDSFLISIRGIRTTLGDMTELFQRGTRVIHEKTEENARNLDGRDTPPSPQADFSRAAGRTCETENKKQ